MKDEALAYAGAGWPVLWVYGVRQDESGVWTCTCPDPNSKVCNPQSSSRGKHVPYGGHGVHDATTDPAIIEAWPWETGPNIGIAGRDTFPIIDIDDPAIVAKLLDPEFGLRDLVTASTTGRGIHIYMQCAPSKNSVPKLKTGEKIGEIRAYGYYVVAPPSMHHSGRAYAWIGESVTVQGPTVSDKDAYTFLAELLAPLGYELADRRDSSKTARDEAVVAVTEWPYQTTNANLLVAVDRPQMFSQSLDRSNDLYHLACDLWRDIKLVGVEVQPIALAGFLKHVDVARGHYHFKGAKYAFRDNSDDMYWDLAQETKTVTDNERVETPQPPPDDAVFTVNEGGAPSFYWVEKPPGFFNNEGRKPVKVSNFEPKIVETVVSWSGDSEDDKGPKRMWNVQLNLPGQPLMSLTVPSDSYADARKFAEFVRAAVTPDYVISDGKAGLFMQGTQEHSGKPPERRAFAFSGWIPGRDAFLLPGAPGAITPDGFDTDTRFESLIMPSRFYQYGWSVGPQEGADLEEVARALINLREPHIMMPLLCQVLGAPLTSLGVGRVPVLVHLFARTGSFKSTVTRITMGLFGRFTNAQLDQVEEWKSTPTSLQITMYRTRDLPLMLDDFKAINFGQKQLADRISLIQVYADRTGPTRSSPTQKEQDHATPRGLVISTGEDVWDGQESALARSLIVDASLNDDPVRVDALKARMTSLQHMAEDGRLGALGYEYLHWLVSRGHKTLMEEIGDLYAKKRAGIVNTELERQHPRTAASVSMLLAVSSLFMTFLQERLPGVLEEYRVIAAEGWGRTLNMAAEKAEEAKAYSPFHQLVGAIISGISTGEAYLAPRVRLTDAYGMSTGEVAGYVDDEAVWLGENTSLAWFNRWKRKQGQDSHVLWRSFVQEAKRDHNASQSSYATPIYLGSPIRLLRIPKVDFFGAEEYAEMIRQIKENTV